jgi:N-acetylglucosamine-6-phosphate deacetylase
VENYVARLVSDGRLAGSTICISKGIRNLVQEVGIPLDKALRLGISNAAKSIRKDHELGRVAVGACADFVLLGDDLQVKSTYIRGNCVYTRQ